VNKIIVLLFFIVMALACEEAIGASIPKTQSDFCLIISSTYNEWSAEVGKPAYIDQNENANAIKQKGKQKFNDFLAGSSGVFEGWKVVISAISVDADALNVSLSVEFSCDAPDWPHNLPNPTLHNMDTFEGQALRIKKGTPIYEALRKFKTGDAVFVAGRFIPLDRVRDIAVDIPARCLVVFEGVGQTADESMAVAEKNRQQELVQQREKHEQELAQQREKQEQEAQKQRAAGEKRRQDLARQREKQEQDLAPKSHEWYMENTRAHNAKLKECGEKSEISQDCSSALQAKRRIDAGEMLSYKSVEWYMNNAKARNAKLKECEKITLKSRNSDCRNAGTAGERVSSRNRNNRQ
jgi:hypothetical protein